MVETLSKLRQCFTLWPDAVVLEVGPLTILLHTPVLITRRLLQLIARPNLKRNAQCKNPSIPASSSGARTLRRVRYDVMALAQE